MKRLIFIAFLTSCLSAPAHAQGFPSGIIQFNFGPPPPHGSFWEGAPPNLGERIHIVDLRMQRLRNEGYLSPGEWDGDRHEFDTINLLYHELTKFEGGTLTPREHDWLWGRLNNLSNRLHWQAGLGY